MLFIDLIGGKMREDYEATIGLEVHCELETKTKNFSIQY